LPFVAQPQAHAVTVIPADLLVIGQPDEAAAAEIGRLPDQKIARFVDDLEACPRLASTAMSAPLREKEVRHA